MMTQTLIESGKHLKVSIYQTGGRATVSADLTRHGVDRLIKILGSLKAALQHAEGAE